MDFTHAGQALAIQSRIGSLHLICGKIAAGKSTLARQLASNPQTVLISEDGWLSQLYPDELQTISDYVRLSSRLRVAMEAHIVDLLRSGTSVVLDFPFNTLNARAWGRSIFEKAGAFHYLHFLDVPDEECKQRLRLRNLSGDHPFQTTDEQFEQITRHFVEPSSREGFNVVFHC
ncbi:ATP-binding protein [Comamonas testosteroni]|uniref:AAA family ATPase n=1 Tax=Comamonas testosteroni TaxID=285 RepID=UPI00265E04FB|nr:ATP-binding protein [Comamonas testosteroni]WKL14474.1 ATP-binding protein [Comamonas testosteroni]